ncbi:MAG: glycerophosphodiester phosphodiesterase family protein [Kocuria sp.]|nr:glycerophosphodiester phosphodiesterase family protein [Kocuria sp.]
MTTTPDQGASAAGIHKVLAHRGFAPDGSENTIPAFCAAQDLGCVWIETDVNTTRDGVVLAFHDATLERVTQGAGQVNDISYQDLTHLVVAGSSPVPTLREVLEQLPEIQVNIDVKDEASVTALADLLKELDAAHRVRIASFSDARRARVLDAMRQRGITPLSTSVGTTGLAAAYVTFHTVPFMWPVVQRALRRHVPAFDTIQMPMYLGWIMPSVKKVPVLGTRLGQLRLTTQRFIQQAHRYGKQVHVWTVNRPRDMQLLLDMGYDGLVTDRADLAIAVLSGAWPTGRCGVDDPTQGSSS